MADGDEHDVEGGPELPPSTAGGVTGDDRIGDDDVTPPLGLDRVEPRGSQPPDRGLIIVGVTLLVVGVVGIVALALTGGNDRVADGEVVGADTEVSLDSTSAVERTTIAPTSSRVSSTTSDPSPVAATSTSAAPDPTTTTSSAPPATAPPLDDEPSVVARPVPVEPPPPPPEAPPPPWASSVTTTSGGHVSTDVGCARDTSAAALDDFFAARIGPVLGWDYQHVYPLGGDRYLWLFQDTFIDHSGTATTLGNASFAHNSALVQQGSCFRLLHRGTTARPTPFELGTGTATLNTWFWPMGGEIHDGRLYVFWARMRKDAIDPTPPDGLGWHPDATFVATYDPATMARLDFRQATQGGATPIYGYVVQSDETWTYLFANSFEQNLSREGGWFNGPHSGTEMYLGRVPRGQLFDQPEYWTADGWIQDRRIAEPFLQRHWSEFPMQPRYMDGQWVASTAVNGYWGDAYELDVANDPWGPWTTVESRPLLPRGADPKMNTYHAHLLPFRDGFGQLIVSVSNNARDMLRDAWPNPARYRPEIFTSPWQVPPPPPPPPTTTTTTTTTTVPPTTTTTTVPSTTTTTTTVPPTTTTTTTTVPPTTTTTTTVPPTTTTTVPPPTTTTTTVPPTSTTVDAADPPAADPDSEPDPESE